jgi:phage terminase large subunit-like protein
MAMSASVAIAKQGREGISALDKSKSTHRIDPVVALVMAAWPFGDGRDVVEEWDVELFIA